jgi:hypothetical protein
MENNSAQLIDGSTRFINLVFDGLPLLIPQNDIYSLEPTVDMTSTATDNGSVGQLKQSGHVWSLYALSSELSLLNSCPETYHIAILMKNVQPAFGLLCEQVDTIDRNQISIHPVPPAMKTENSPLLALALYGDEVRYISSASALSHLLTQGQV